MSDVYLDAAMAAKLREPFPDAVVGKLPRVSCGACRNSREKACDKHAKSRCAVCRNWITSAHIHLDYVGHAETTDRLLAADPLWTWNPLAIDDQGLPAFDSHGGLWITLTVGGVSRLGYGSADGKEGPDAIKETIGDALRNAAMRFGVAIDLWGAKFKDEDEPSGHQAADAVAEADQHDRRPERTKAKVNATAQLRGQIASHEKAKGKTIDEIADDFKAFTGGNISSAKGTELQAYLRHIGVPLVDGDQEWQAEPTPMVTQEQQRVLHTLLGETHMTPSERMEYVSGIVGHPVPSAHDLTRDEAEKVIAELTAKVSPTEPADWPKVTEPPK